jgi:hypothetical protein
MNTGPPMRCVTPQPCLLIGGAVTDRLQDAGRRECIVELPN